MITQQQLDRIQSRLIIDNNGCHVWQGCLVKGYGQTYVNSNKAYVHRVMYEWHTGSIDPTLTIDHTCRNKACANPLHLEEVTLEENVKRAYAYRIDPTECRKGHVYAITGRYVSPTGRAQCQECKREYERAKRVRPLKP